MTLPPRRRSVLGGLGLGSLTTAAALNGLSTPAAAATATAPAPAGSPAQDIPLVSYRDKQLLIDGEPTLILAGEIHYFRLHRKDWQSRLDLAKEAGLNAIATYVPWLWHELPDGSLDVTGKSRPERDLGAFIDLCVDNGFYVIPRPGPFIMAETKNDGIPHRVYREHPEIVATGWDGRKATTPTVDYLAPAFLAEAERWYQAVMPVIAQRMRRDGKPSVVGVQLDNEIGMLAWVSNGPDLTDHLLKDFNGWLDRTYGDQLGDRYPFAGKPADQRDAAIRAPENAWSATLMHDLGTFMRGRFARYVAALRGYAEAAGVTGVPFIINIHGTSAGRAEMYPIGISQLLETYSGVDGMISGSDMYLGELTLRNLPDLYLVNAFTDATNDRDQPLTSLEFDAGHGDYGQALEVAFHPETPVLKTRMCLAQGAKLINYYLFSGGFNPLMDDSLDDGNNRVGTTGELHGFNAPVAPDGTRNYSYAGTRKAARDTMALGPQLARMRTEYDQVSLAFVPDHYLTEYHPPGRDKADAVLQDVQGWRGSGPRGGSLARSMLLSQLRYDSVNLQAGDLDPKRTPVLALAGCEHLSERLQQRLVRYVTAGGRLLLAGKLPVKDETGDQCHVLADGLGLRPLDTITGRQHFYPSVTGHEWAASQPEVRVDRAQLCEVSGSGGRTLLKEVSTGKGCGFDLPVGEGRVVAVLTDYVTHLSFWRRAFEAIGASAALTHTAKMPGVVLLSTSGPDGRLLHAFNVTSGYDQSFTVAERGKPLFGGESLRLPGQSAVMLPLGLTVGGLTVVYATAEIIGHGNGSVTFRTVADEAVVAVEGRASCEGAKSSYEDGRTLFRVRRSEFTVRRD